MATRMLSLSRLGFAGGDSDILSLSLFLDSDVLVATRMCWCHWTDSDVLADVLVPSDRGW